MACLLILLLLFFKEPKFLILIKSSSSFMLAMDHVWYCIQKGMIIYYVIFYILVFYSLHFTYDPVWVNFCKYNICIYFFAYGCPASFIEGVNFAPLCCLCSFVNMSPLYLRGSISRVVILIHWSVYFSPLPHLICMLLLSHPTTGSSFYMLSHIVMVCHQSGALGF